MNPFLIEYRRLSRNNWLLILAIAISLTLVDYFVSLQSRLEHKQVLLNAATDDMEHQLQPFVHALKVLQQDAEIALLQPLLVETPELLGQQMRLVAQAGEKTQALLPIEQQMLSQISLSMKFTARSLQPVKQLAYLSNTGIWFQPSEQRSVTHETMAQLFWQTMQQKTYLDEKLTVRLHKLKLDKDVFILSQPVFIKDKAVGVLMMEVDLASVISQLSKIQLNATMMLLDGVGDVLLAARAGEIVMLPVHDGINHNDTLSSMELLPLALYIQPDSGDSALFELLQFSSQLLLNIVALAMLAIYNKRRFKNKVLAPFSRFLVHLTRLERGDLQGVRHIPADWSPLFRQIDHLCQIVPASTKVNDD